MYVMDYKYEATCVQIFDNTNDEFLYYTNTTSGSDVGVDY